MSSEEDVVRNVMSGGYSPNLPYENGVNGITSKMNTPGYLPDNKEYKGILEMINPLNKIKQSYNKLNQAKDYLIKNIMPQPKYLAPQY